MTAPIPDEGRPTRDTDPKGREGGAFTLAGRVAQWDASERELTIGGRVLRVDASVFIVADLVAGVTIIASGHESPGPGTRWVVTHLRVA